MASTAREPSEIVHADHRLPRAHLGLARLYPQRGGTGVLGALPGLGQRFDATYVVSAPRAPGERLVSDPSPDYCNAGNQQVSDLIRGSRWRALGLCYVNPRHTAASLAVMEEWIGRRGFVGLKLLVATHCDRPELDPLVDWCAAAASRCASTPGSRPAGISPAS